MYRFCLMWLEINESYKDTLGTENYRTSQTFFPIKMKVKSFKFDENKQKKNP